MAKGKGNSRVSYDMQAWASTCGDIGRLQTQKRYYLMAGDTIDLNFKSVFRLSPLRRNMYMDCVVDNFAFFVPHRHVYGQNWIDFMLDGVDEGITFTTRTMTGNLECCACHFDAGDTVPLHIPQGFLNIFNRYFKDPTEADYAASYFDALAAGDSTLKFGIPCGYHPRVWNTGITAGVTSADYRFGLTDANTTVDLLSMVDQQGRLATERIREWKGRRYTDVMREVYGAGVNVDADQRPTLLAHNSSWLTGFDVNVTDSAGVGDFSGKGASTGQLNIPPFFVKEHGVIWIMSLLRFPPVHMREVEYLDLKTQPTYSQISGDPDIVGRTAPIVSNTAEYIKGATATDVGNIPSHQWLRAPANSIHVEYRSVTGHPYIETAFSTKAQTKYIDPTIYDACFNSMPLRHWQSQGIVSGYVKRLAPGVDSSIFAGTH